jgi:hypothetical protein
MHHKLLAEIDLPASWLQPTLPYNAAFTCLPFLSQSALNPSRPHSRPWGFCFLCSTGVARMCFLLQFFVAVHLVCLGYLKWGLSLGLLFLTLVLVTFLIALNVLSPIVHMLSFWILCFLFPACDKLRVGPLSLHSSMGSMFRPSFRALPTSYEHRGPVHCDAQVSLGSTNHHSLSLSSWFCLNQVLLFFQVSCSSNSVSARPLQAGRPSAVLLISSFEVGFCVPPSFSIPSLSSPY